MLQVPIKTELSLSGPAWSPPTPPQQDGQFDGVVASILDRQVQLPPEGIDFSLYELIRGWVQNAPNLGQMQPSPLITPQPRLSPGCLEVNSAPPRFTDIHVGDSFQPEDTLHKLKAHWVAVRRHHQSQAAEQAARVAPRLNTLIKVDPPTFPDMQASLAMQSAMQSAMQMPFPGAFGPFPSLQLLGSGAVASDTSQGDGPPPNLGPQGLPDHLHSFLPPGMSMPMLPPLDSLGPLGLLGLSSLPPLTEAVGPQGPKQASLLEVQEPAQGGTAAADARVQAQGQLPPVPLHPPSLLQSVPDLPLSLLPPS